MTPRAHPLPADPRALYHFALQLDRAGRAVESIAAWEQFLQQRPDLADAWFNLGQARWHARRFDEALSAYAEALQRGLLGPEDAYLNRAVILARHLGRLDDALTELEKALVLRPDHAPAWLNLGNVHEQRGQREAAARAYQRLLEIEPGHALALARLVQLRPLRGPDDPLIAQLRQALALPSLPQNERADLAFGLGKALDEVASYGEAFAAYEVANAASRQAGEADARYDPAAHERHVDRLIATFVERAQGPMTGSRPPPIFICGMFRSGSTLVEQMLAAHPQVTAGGEIDMLPALAARHLAPRDPWPVLDDAVALRGLARAYLETIERRFPGAGLLTDKRPDNFLHIGLIKTLFPDARIVHTRRDPLDNGLSLYFLHLGRDMPYALDLHHIGHWYRQHDRLMAHWRRLYGPDIHEVNYDELVVDPEPVLRRLLAFCGLPWDARCLDFHTSDRTVQTASLWQVRQPLYRRASGRWRHYEPYIGPLREALAS